MRMSIVKVFNLLLLSLLLFLFVGCGSPSNSDAERAIRNAISGADIKELKIIEIGSAQGKGSNQYWEVKVFISGIYSQGYDRGKLSEFETIYKVSKDGFDVWIAKHKF